MGALLLVLLSDVVVIVKKYKICKQTDEHQVKDNKKCIEDVVDFVIFENTIEVKHHINTLVVVLFDVENAVSE